MWRWGRMDLPVSKIIYKHNAKMGMLVKIISQKSSRGNEQCMILLKSTTLPRLIVRYYMGRLHAIYKAWSRRVTRNFVMLAVNICRSSSGWMLLLGRTLVTVGIEAFFRRNLTSKCLLDKVPPVFLGVSRKRLSRC